MLSCEPIAQAKDQIANVVKVQVVPDDLREVGPVYSRVQDLSIIHEGFLDSDSGFDQGLC